MDSHKNNNEINLKKISIVVGCIIILLWICSYFVTKWIGDGNLIGDSYGAINALFSGLALAGIILTILMQRDELKLQRKELELTRVEMEMTRDEFVTQNSTLKLQQFENTYFQMLSIFHKNIEQTSLKIKLNTYEKKDVFKVFIYQIDTSIEELIKSKINNNLLKVDSNESVDKIGRETISKDEIVKIYRHLHKRYEPIMSQYFSTLFIILKLIDNAQIRDKPFYISIITSQFTSLEILIVFYHSLSNFENHLFRDLFEKYKLIDKLIIKLLPNANILQEYRNKKKSTLLLL